MYGFTDAPKQHSYNNVIYTYTPIEHKDYNRSEMINLFLAVLELLKMQEIVVKQQSIYEEIDIELKEKEVVENAN